MKRILQFVENLVPGDAISNDCLQIHYYLKGLGYDSYIYTRFSVFNAPFIQPYLSQIFENDSVIFHHSTFSPLVDYIRQLPNKKMLIYHNITPAAFFKKNKFDLYKTFKEAERQNYLLEDVHFDAVVGDSEYNISQIKKFLTADYENVFPPFLSLQFKRNPSEKMKETTADNFTIIFVGRFAPNKRQIDIIKVFEYYSKFINPKAKLILIGHYGYEDAYFTNILSYIKDRDIKNIIIKGSVSSEELADDFNSTDVFLSMSEHEGFCIPILESLHFNVPVLAYKIPALEELLDSKYLFEKKDYKKVGEMLFKIQNSNELKKKMIKEQKKVLHRFDETKIKSKFKSFISKVFI